ncbi:MAG: GntR family transcriptional regulator [Burkholderiaceae bacterium]|nr:GntR family transcriptional regulator [Burkholderiaceae bacterium]
MNRTTPIEGGASASPARFRAIRSARAFEEIAAQIRTELSEGRLRVGSRLPSERALSEQFGVSRNTLREALRSLENAGLIRLQKGASGGAFISERSGEAIATGLLDLYHIGAIQPAQLTEARIWLETIIVREACARATPQDIEELNENIRLADEAGKQGRFDLRARRNLDFHRILARMTGNPIMVVVMNGVLDVLAAFIEKIGDSENPFVSPSRRRFMKHLVARDTDAAVAEMEANLKRLQRNYLSRIENEGQGPVVPPAPAPEPAATGGRRRRPAGKASER